MQTKYAHLKAFIEGYEDTEDVTLRPLPRAPSESLVTTRLRNAEAQLENFGTVEECYNLGSLFARGYTLNWVGTELLCCEIVRNLK